MSCRRDIRSIWGMSNEQEKLKVSGTFGLTFFLFMVRFRYYGTTETDNIWRVFLPCSQPCQRAVAAIYEECQCYGTRSDFVQRHRAVRHADTRLRPDEEKKVPDTFNLTAFLLVFCGGRSFSLCCLAKHRRTADFKRNFEIIPYDSFSQFFYVVNCQRFRALPNRATPPATAPLH